MSSGSSSNTPDKIEFKMLDYSVIDNDTVSFKLEDGTIVKVKVGLDRVGVATNFKNPDGSLHYAVNTSVKMYVIPHDKRFTLSKSQVKSSSGQAGQPSVSGTSSRPNHIA